MAEVRGKYPKMHGIALSGFGMEEDRRRSTEAGFRYHLTKPIDFAVLQMILGSIGFE